MGYQTDFEGCFELDRELASEHFAYLHQFAETRRMKRDPQKALSLPDPIRVAVGLPIGEDGEYFVGGAGMCGQDRDASILDYNREPSTQPGLWCKWAPNENGDTIEWNGNEKFYDYIEWLRYLLDHFLKPWGYVLNGVVYWNGEERGDVGIIEVVDNVVTVHEKVLELPKKSVDKPVTIGVTAPIVRITCPHCAGEVVLAAVVVKT